MPRTVAQIEGEMELVQNAINKILERIGVDAIVAYQTSGRGASIARAPELDLLFKRLDALVLEKDIATQGTRRGPRTFSVFPT